MNTISFRPQVIIDEQQNKLTAMACWGKDLVLGTEKGHVIVYEIEPKASDPALSEDAQQKQFNVGIKNLYKDFSKKPITQINFVEEEKIMLSLSDGIISVHNLPLMNRAKISDKTSEKLKGTVMYTVDRSDGILRIVSCQKKKLTLCEWVSGDLVIKKELSVPETVKTCLFCGTSLCIGFRGEYNLIDIQTGGMTPLFATGKSLPIGISLPQQQLLLGRDNISVFIGYDGKPTRRYGLSWGETPLETCYNFPFVIALLQKTVEIQLVFGGLLQSFPIGSAAFVSVSSDGSVYIANRIKNWSVWKLSPVDFSEQLDTLEKRGKYPEARSLCENLEKTHVPDRDERLQRLQLLNAYQNFNQGHYGRAMDTFFALKVDPLQVIALYKDFLPQKVRQRFSFPIKIEQLEGASLNKALIALVSYLEQKRKDLKLSEILKQRAEINSSNSSGSSSSLQGYGRSNYDAVAEVGGTNQVEWVDTAALGQIIDTSLLRAYVKTDPSFVGNLIGIPNFCHVKECEAILLSSARFIELVALYKSRDMHSNALKLLQRLGQLDKEKQKNTTLLGPKPSIDYMKTLGKDDIELILEFSTWPLKESPNEAMDIFLALRPPSKQLPPSKVLAHLESLASKNPPEINSVLVVRYLEFIINELGDETNDFHNKLAQYYFDIVLNLKRKETDPTISKMVAGTEPNQLGKMRTKLLDFLEESKFYTPAIMLSNYNFTEDGLHEEKAILLSKIGHHFEALKEYVHKLHDFTMAEEYCAAHYNTENEEARDVYLSLLQVYMTPPTTPDAPSKESLQKAAITLLNKHFKEIDPTKALDTLPELMPLSSLDTYFEKVLREINQEKRNKQIIANIQKCETIKVKSELLKLRSRVIKITDDTLCPSCNRRIGDTAFAYYPNGTVIHYLCYKRAADKYVCPVTGERFDPY